MILSPKTVLISNMVTRDEQIEGYHQTPLKNCIQQSGLDVDVIEISLVQNEYVELGGKLNRIVYLESDDAQSGIKNRNNLRKLTPNSFHIAKDGKEEVIFGWYLNRNCAYDFSSSFNIKMPDDKVAYLKTRSTLNRNGIQIQSGLYDPGFNGKIGGVIYTGNEDVFLSYGSRVAQLIVETCEIVPADELYNGQYQTN